MSTAKFTILKDRKNKDKRHPLVLRISSGNTRSYIYTGYYSNKDEWDEETETITSEYKIKKPSRAQINAYLVKQKARVQEIHEHFQRDGINDYSKDQFVNLFNKRDKQRITVFGAFTERIKELKDSNRIGNANAYNTTYLAFKAWKKTDIQLRDITPEILHKWADHLKQKEVKDTSISFYMRTLRALYRYAIQKEWVREEYYPFREFKVSEFSTETSPRALDSDRLMKLLTMEVYPDLQLAQDIFIFSFYGRGSALLILRY